MITMTFYRCGRLEHVVKFICGGDGTDLLIKASDLQWLNLSGMMKHVHETIGGDESDSFIRFDNISKVRFSRVSMDKARKYSSFYDALGVIEANIDERLFEKLVSYDRFVDWMTSIGDYVSEDSEVGVESGWFYIHNWSLLIEDTDKFGNVMSMPLRTIKRIIGLAA